MLGASVLPFLGSTKVLLVLPLVVFIVLSIFSREVASGEGLGTATSGWATRICGVPEFQAIIVRCGSGVLSTGVASGTIPATLVVTPVFRPVFSG